MDFDNCSNKVYIKFIDDQFNYTLSEDLITKYGTGSKDKRHVILLEKFTKFILLEGEEEKDITKYFALGELDPTMKVKDFTNEVHELYPGIVKLENEMYDVYHYNATGFTHGIPYSNPTNFIRKVVHDWAHNIIGTNSNDWISEVDSIRRNPWRE